VTTALPIGLLTVFSAPSNMSLAFESFGPEASVLATQGGAPANAAVMAAEAGATLLGAHTAPARRVFLFFEDVSWLAATDPAKQIFDQAVYWALGRAIPTPDPDLDHDRDVDGDDYILFAACASGPDVPHDGTPLCQQADADDDNDVDHADFGPFQACYQGENVLAAIDCAE
jgi:hypothetical protein